MKKHKNCRSVRYRLQANTAIAVRAGHPWRFIGTSKAFEELSEFRAMIANNMRMDNSIGLRCIYRVVIVNE